MRRFLPFSLVTLLALLICWGATTTQADVVRPAPAFTWAGADGRAHSLTEFRGQPVVLVIARSPRDRRFRAQANRLEQLFRKFAARDTVFAAAFTESDGRIPSNIPFVVVDNPQQVAAAYNVAERGFGVAVVGMDGNLDSIVSRVQPAEYVRDTIDNSYVIQERLRP